MTAAASDGWRARWHGWLSVFAIAGFALSLPLFRVLGPHPEFFLAHGVGPTGVVVFAVAVAIVVPAALATLATVVGWGSRAARSVVVAAVSIVAVAGILQALSGIVLFPLVAVVGGIVVASWERNNEVLRSGLAVASVVSVVALGWFVGLSRTSSYVFSSDGEPIELTAAEDLSPVVFLVFDEFPATVLLTSDLEINAERYPNFARLADQSDWFWKASSVSPQTSWSVPAILSGVAPTDAVAVGSNYPTNVFRQLGGAYEVFEYEPITALCPDSVCGGSPQQRVDSRPDGSVSSLLSDTAVVFGHAVGSDEIREQLPPIDHSWSGFGAEAPANDSEHEPDEYASLGSDALFPGALERLKLLIEQQPSGVEPPMFVGHFLAPHMPYMASPDGSTYDVDAQLGMETRNGGLVWPSVPVDDVDAQRDAEAYRRQGYQRLVLQVGALDRELGQMIETLEGSGVWDDAVVVVTADHGAMFEPGAFRSVHDGGAEVWNVPLFIKAPGQTEGTRRDETALTIDALPTLMGLVGVDRDVDFDGVDLNGGQVPDDRPDAYDDGFGPHTIDQSEAAIRSVVDRRATWFSPDGGWDEVLRAGPGGALIGGPVPAEAGSPGGFWSTSVDESGHMQTLQLVEVATDPDSPPPDGVLVAVDGHFVGGGAPLVSAGDGVYRVWTVVDPFTDVRPDGASVFAVRPDGSLAPLAYDPGS